MSDRQNITLNEGLKTAARQMIENCRHYLVEDQDFWLPREGECSLNYSGDCPICQINQICPTWAKIRNFDKKDWYLTVPNPDNFEDFDLEFYQENEKF